MKKSYLWSFLILALFGTAQADPNSLPSFNLPDPRGTMHSSSTLATHGLVVIVSSPTLHDKSAQEGWSRDLVATRGGHPAPVILIEDMTATAFEEIAESHMKKSWKPGTLPILLEDKTGKIHGAFAVGKEETKVFVYDKKGKLVYSTAKTPSTSAAKAAWAKLSK